MKKRAAHDRNGGGGGRQGIRLQLTGLAALHPEVVRLRPIRAKTKKSATTAFEIPARGSQADLIFIPAFAREWEISRLALSSRLTNILGSYGCQRLGDLHGRRLSNLLKWRNLGKITLQELRATIQSLRPGGADTAGADDFEI